MKKVVILALATLLAVGIKAQSIMETVTTVGNLTVPACTVSLEKDAKLVQAAMGQYLKDLKLKTAKEEGYTVALNALVETIATSPVNLYTKVEEQGKKKNRTTVVTVSAISTDLTIDQQTLRGNVRNWLAAFVDYIGRYEAMQQMASEQQNLKKAEKVAASAAASVSAIDKNIEKDQKKIADKQKQIAKLQKQIKDLENDIKKLESNIEKSRSKRGDAEKKVEQANQGVQEAEGEVERYRQMAQ